MAEIPSGRVILTIEDLLADLDDGDFFLDSQVLSGEVTFAASIGGFTYDNGDSTHTMMRLPAQKCPIIDGVLYPPDTVKSDVMPPPGVLLPSTTQPDGVPSEFAWTAYIRLFRAHNVQQLAPRHFLLEEGAEVDLAMTLPVEAPSGVVYVVQDAAGFVTHPVLADVLGGLTLQLVTQAEYDAMPTPRSTTTLYVITP